MALRRKRHAFSRLVNGKARNVKSHENDGAYHVELMRKLDTLTTISCVRHIDKHIDPRNGGWQLKSVCDGSVAALALILSSIDIRLDNRVWAFSLLRST
jgi:hypothetical protein